MDGIILKPITHSLQKCIKPIPVKVSTLQPIGGGWSHIMFGHETPNGGFNTSLLLNLYQDQDSNQNSADDLKHQILRQALLSSAMTRQMVYTPLC